MSALASFDESWYAMIELMRDFRQTGEWDDALGANALLVEIQTDYYDEAIRRGFKEDLQILKRWQQEIIPELVEEYGAEEMHGLLDRGSDILRGDYDPKEDGAQEWLWAYTALKSLEQVSGKRLPYSEETQAIAQSLWTHQR